MGALPRNARTLGSLREEGWEHVVLSNHVPELDEIIRCLGLHELVSAVVNSAVTGYEKPHPKAFEIATSRAQCPTNLWMVGDSHEADARAEPNAPEFERFSFDATIRLFGVVLPTSEPRLC